MPAPDPVRRFYEANPRMISSPFGGIHGIDADLLRGALERLAIRLEGRRILDVGCGRGYAAGVAAALGGAYTGLDFVRSRAGFPFVQGDAARLPFRDAAFDVLFCIDASEHFPAPHETALEFRRVLRPGGTLFLSAPNYANVAGLVKWWCERRGRYAPRTWAPFGRWQPQELEYPLTPRYLRRLYLEAGFSRMRAAAHAPEVLLGLCPWADHPRAPDALRFRLQRLFRVIGPPIAAVCPAASLHLFWRIDA